MLMWYATPRKKGLVISSLNNLTACGIINKTRGIRGRGEYMEEWWWMFVLGSIPQGQGWSGRGMLKYSGEEVLALRSWKILFLHELSLRFWWNSQMELTSDKVAAQNYYRFWVHYVLDSEVGMWMHCLTQPQHRAD